VREALNASRIAAFSDGVFSVAITLLAFGLHVPDDKTPLAWQLHDHAADYSIAFVSFVLVGIKWLNHHRVFGRITSVDTTLISLNLLLLMGITTVPFATALLATHVGTTDAALASLIYGLLWAINGWLYAAIARRGTGRVSALWVLAPLGYVVGGALGYLNVYLAIALYLILALLFVAPERAERNS